MNASIYLNVGKTGTSQQGVQGDISKVVNVVDHREVGNIAECVWDDTVENPLVVQKRINTTNGL